MTDGTLNLKEVLITHNDGTTEKVYVEDDSINKKTWKDYLPMIYTTVGIVALTLTIIVTVRQLKK
jgi:hypothetical protein